MLVYANRLRQMLLLGWLLFPALALWAEDSLSSGSSSPGTLRGTVTIAGLPAVHVLVEVYGDPAAEEIITDGFTDRQGRFHLTLAPGRYLLRAQRTLSDRSGYSHSLRSPLSTPVDVPAGETITIDLSLREEDIRGRWVRVDDAVLRQLVEWRPSLSADEAARLEDLFRQILSTEDPAHRRQLYLAHADLIRRSECEDFTALYEVAMKESEHRQDFPSWLRLAGLLDELGETLEHPWLRSSAAVQRTIVFLKQLDISNALAAIEQAATYATQAVEAETRPGFRQTRQQELASVLVVVDIVRGILQDRAGARQARTRALVIQRELDLPRHQAESHLSLAQTAIVLQDTVGAMNHYRHAAALFAALEDPSRQSQSLRPLGLLQDEQGFYIEARKSFRTLLELDTQLNDRPNAALDCQLIADSHLYLEEHAAARQWFLQASTAYYEVGGDYIPLAIATMRHAAGTCLLNPGKEDLAAALPLYEEALELSVTHGVEEEQPRIHLEMGIGFLLHGGDTEESLRRSVEHLQKARALFEKRQESELARSTADKLALAQNYLGRTLARSENSTQARQAYQKALAIYTEIGNAGRVAHMRQTLGTFHFRQGQWLEAVAHYEAYATWLASPQAGQEYEQRAAELNPEEKALFHPQRNYASTLHLLSLLHGYLGDPDQALQALNRSLAAWQALGTAQQVFAARSTKVFQRFFAGDFPGYREALAALEADAANDDQRAQVMALRLMEDTAADEPQQRQRRVAASRQWLESRLELARGLPPEERAGFSSAWGMVGSLLAFSGRPREGIPCMETAFALAPGETRAVILLAMGRAYRSLGNLQEALDGYQAFYAQRRSLAPFGEPSEQVLMLLDMAEMQRAVGDEEGLNASLREAFALAEKIDQQPSLQPGDHKALGDLWGIVGQGEFTAGNTDAALAALGAAAAHYQHTGVDERSLRARVFYILARDLKITTDYATAAE